MKTECDVVLVIPIGPRCLPEFIEDTIQSFIHYTRAEYRIILADDSHKGTGQQLLKKFPDAELVSTPHPMGKLCGLYITLSLAFRHALQHYHFKTLLRLDTDALVIGSHPEKAAIELLAEHPETGIAGQYPLDYHGDPWDIDWPRQQLRKFFHSYKFFKRPLTHLFLIQHYNKAKRKGYHTGESVFGGACFYSERFLARLNKKGLLPNYLLKDMDLEEDHLFSLLAKSLGYQLGDLSSGNGPFGCSWIGLPASPEELHRSGKKIIHSTRLWNGLEEKEIRDYFRKRRETHSPSFQKEQLHN